MTGLDWMLYLVWSRSQLVVSGRDPNWWCLVATPTGGVWSRPQLVVSGRDPNWWCLVAILPAGGRDGTGRVPGWWSLP